MEGEPQLLHIVFLRSPRFLNHFWTIFIMRSTSSPSPRLVSTALTFTRGLAAVGVVSTLLACSASMAQQQSREGGRKGPPAEALSVCKSAKSGDSCSFSTPNGTVSGSCMAPEGRPLACASAQGQGSNSSSAPR